ncbi:methyltransferase domain-containing protein [Lentimicrobium sp. L6]|uniref:methyltransferase domain-containing protein n=1 Tax=Lentimicrobium sp. L6 TaxID=2735916 RepID=UPI0015536D0A|nr:methyltransferase domain-containing protein [Lentimicrobium sp. L6]NPD87001.1 methyltransferase domain-containing protein [Lentimicrobium sp. L6]
MNDIKKQFQKRASDYNSYTKWLKDEELFRLCTLPLRDYPNNAKCLDIGGGTGWLAYKDYKESGRKWTVVDISEDMGNIVPNEIEFICSKAESIPLPDESFDFIIIRSVLEYTEVDKVLLEVKRLLKEEGYFVLAQKVMDGYITDINLILKLEQLRNPLKKNLGFMSNINKSVSKTNLRILNSRTYTQNYSISYDKWLKRNGTIPEANQKELENIINNLEVDVSSRTGLKLIDNNLHSKLTWGIITCHKNSYVNPRINIVVSMIVEKTLNDKKYIVLQKRKYLYTEPHYYNVWELPQGKVEKDETIFETAKRELFEETGLNLFGSLLPNSIETINDITLNQSDVLTTVFAKGGMNYLGVCVLVKAEGEFETGIQDTEPQWVEVGSLKNKLENERFFPLNIPMIKKYIEYVG